MQRQLANNEIVLINLETKPKPAHFIEKPDCSTLCVDAVAGIARTVTTYG